MKWYQVHVFAALVAGIPIKAQEPPVVHDPVMIRQDSVYYLYCTGWGISCFSSKDMKTWKMEKPVFATPPKWATESISGYKGHTWAPDISFYQGKYRLFYAVSAFGKNTSCIGLAENTTLHPADPGFKWVDRGKIVQSVPGRDDWNAIDPNLIVDSYGHPWLNFGSFWSGIKLVKLKDDLSGVTEPEEWYGLAKRSRTASANDKEAGDGAIEAPFIVRHEKFYYLFVSFDYCCQGVKSNYKIMVGRSKELTGPYVDKQGVPMMIGGGSLVLEGDRRWPGLGHCAVYTFDGRDYIIFHAYDASDNGKPKLLIKELFWDQAGWPNARLDE